MNRFYATLKALKEIAAVGTSIAAEPAGKDGEMTAQLQVLRERFIDSMDDDFNTARAIGHLFDAVRLINTALAEKKPGVSSGVFLQAGKDPSGDRFRAKIFPGGTRCLPVPGPGAGSGEAGSARCGDRTSDCRASGGAGGEGVAAGR